MARVRVQVPIDQSKQQIAAVEPAPALVNPGGSWFTKNNLVKLALAGLVVIILFVLLNDRNQLKEQVDKLSTTQPVPANDVQKYQEEIGKIVELPSGQTPSLIPVTDAKKLASENPFFKHAQDGDVVLLYVSPDKSVRAILYRPSTKKVIEATSSATIGAGSTAPVKQ